MCIPHKLGVGKSSLLNAAVLSSLALQISTSSNIFSVVAKSLHGDLQTSTFLKLLLHEWFGVHIILGTGMWLFRLGIPPFFVVLW